VKYIFTVRRARTINSDGGRRTLVMLVVIEVIDNNHGSHTRLFTNFTPDTRRSASDSGNWLMRLVRLLFGLSNNDRLTAFDPGQPG